MKPPAPTAEQSTSPPGYYTYRSLGEGPLIHLSLEAVDGILGEVLTGFGAIPRRGAEVGGLLLGRTSGNEVWIESFAIIACEHRRGPSFLVSETDEAGLAELVDQHRTGEAVPVGMFRSNTRDRNTLADEDRELFGQYFPAPVGVFLLIRPYASKTSTGTFIVYRDGVLPDDESDTFPFQRWELEGGPAPRRRSLGETRSRQKSETPPRIELPEDEAMVVSEHSMLAPATPISGAEFSLADSRTEEAEDVFGGSEDSSIGSRLVRQRRGWVWIPLSFMFLLLGVLLGFQSAVTFYPRPALDPSAFALGLTAAGTDENLHIHWNRDALAIRSAERGRLEIQDGKYLKTVDLDANSLQTGSVVYPPINPKVNLRLQVTIKGANAVSENLDWSRKQ